MRGYGTAVPAAMGRPQPRRVLENRRNNSASLRLCVSAFSGRVGAWRLGVEKRGAGSVLICLICGPFGWVDGPCTLNPASGGVGGWICVNLRDLRADQVAWCPWCLGGDNIRSHAESEKQKTETDEQHGDRLAGKAEEVAHAHLKGL